MTGADISPAQAAMARLAGQLRGVPREEAHRRIDEALDRLEVTDLAAIAYDWSFWARPKQIAPSTAWRSWGWLGGRGLGKTRSVAEYINGEVFAGRAMSIGLAAQDEANSVDLQVLGPSGLLTISPPWFRPEWRASDMQLVWPNGARAYVRTPEVPGKIRGFEYQLSWICELQSWPAATRDEAYSNFLIATRLGYGRLVWDATPKKRHPLLRELLKASELEPDVHVVVRGRMQENEANLGAGYVAAIVQKFGGTQKGREEIEGEMLDDSESALVKSDWIEERKRALPSAFMRKVIGVDPAVTTRGGSDSTGISLCGLGTDGQAYVLADLTGKHDPPTWAAIVLDRYVKDGCDLVIVETNKGGLLLTQNLRACARDRGLTVVVIGKEDRAPGRASGTVFVREVYGRGSKEDRAQPICTAYERGAISHVYGANLQELETMLTTWEPSTGQRSPDRLDPLVYAIGELLGLAVNEPDAKAGFVGITEMSAALTARREETAVQEAGFDIAALLRNGGRGERI